MKLHVTSGPPLHCIRTWYLVAGLSGSGGTSLGLPNASTSSVATAAPSPRSQGSTRRVARMPRLRALAVEHGLYRSGQEVNQTTPARHGSCPSLAAGAMTATYLSWSAATDDATHPTRPRDT